MSFPEMQQCFEIEKEAYQEGWEQTRIIAYSSAHTRKTIMSYLPLPWDKEKLKKKEAEDQKKALQTPVTRLFNTVKLIADLENSKKTDKRVIFKGSIGNKQKKVEPSKNRNYGRKK